MSDKNKNEFMSAPQMPSSSGETSKAASRISLNEALKNRAEEEAQRDSRNSGMKLDDTQRVKVLSPGRLVFKRFIRNKLAIIGVCILAFMFLFCFLGAVLYPYGQTQIFYKYDTVNSVYAGATQRTDVINYPVDETVTISGTVQRMMNSYISQMETAGKTSMEITDDTVYSLIKKGEGIYTLEKSDGEVVASFSGTTEVGTIDMGSKKVVYSGAELGASFEEAAASALGKDSFTVDGVTYTLKKKNKLTYTITSTGSSIRYTGASLGATFEEAVFAAAEEGKGAFELEGVTYSVSETDAVYSVKRIDNSSVVMVSSPIVFNTFDSATTFTDAVRAQALLNAYTGDKFTVEGTSYQVKTEDGELMLYAGGEKVAMMSDFAVRDAKGNDVFDVAFKEATQDAIQAMQDAGQKTATFVYAIPERVIELDENGSEYIKTTTDENGNVVYVETELTINKEVSQFTITCPQLRNLIDINGGPSWSHPFGTDGDGMDILARMMYGGRVSLMVGFVVVFIETVLGVIMGGLAGYFGGWIDNLVMRLVDIFYCIPSMPILIILGSVMDSMKVTPYVRLVYMMIVLGVLGWAGVARLVRGQILSLREQEFMVATEATGVRVSRRIFRHLVPNVMPQLIVTATAGLGSVILTESTLSFLGLGVKHPLATWGTMINSVTQSNESMIKYTYIWIPVGLLICLTVVAFNFVGDGLRDAFDPKMKR